MEAALERVCLVVDDEESIRTFLGVILKAQGFQILEAEDATQALKLVHRLKGALCVMISDIRMPGDMDGLDLAHAIRHTFPTIPIILMSGYADQKDTSFADFHFLPKPFRSDAVLGALTEEGFSVNRRTASE